MNRHKDQIIVYRGHKLYVVSEFTAYEKNPTIFEHDESVCCLKDLGNDDSGWWDELISIETLYNQSAFNALNLAEFTLKMGVGSPIEEFCNFRPLQLKTPKNG